MARNSRINNDISENNKLIKVIENFGLKIDCELIIDYCDIFQKIVNSLDKKNIEN